MAECFLHASEHEREEGKEENAYDPGDGHQGSLTPTFQSTVHWKELQDSGEMLCDVLPLHINAAPCEGHAVSA